MYYLYKKENILGVWKDATHGLLKLEKVLIGKISSAWTMAKVLKIQLRNGNWTLVYESNFMHRIVERASLEAL